MCRGFWDDVLCVAASSKQSRYLWPLPEILLRVEILAQHMVLFQIHREVGAGKAFHSHNQKFITETAIYLYHQLTSYLCTKFTP